MRHASPAEERRSGIRLLIIGAVCMVLAFGMWWLVETTNPIGEHDAHLLPWFALIPLLLGAYHLYSSHRQS